MNARPLPLWLTNGLVGCAFFFGGYTVTRLRVEADYPLAFWPSAGIALAACLRWGRGVLPGIAAGAFLLFFWLRIEIGGPLGPAFARAGVGMVASIVQAAAGAWAVRRGLGFPHELGRGRDVVAFWLLGGLLFTWITPACSVALFAWAGDVDAHVLRRSFETWWLAQALGVMVAAPVALALVMPREGAWLHRPWTVSLPVSAAVLGELVVLDLVGLGRSDITGVDFLWRSYLFQTWALLTAGLALCALFAALLLVLTARSATVRRLVEQRMIEVKHYTAELEHEIAERRRTEERLRRAMETAAQASRVKSEFLGNVSHELRTPLNAVIGMTELALDTPLSTEQRGYLLTAQNAGRQLLGQIGSLLDFTQLAGGSLRARSQPFSLRELLAQTLADDAERARARGLRLRWQVAHALPDALVGDPLRLRQILQQLVDNAIKFTQRGGVDIVVSALPATGDSGDLLCIEVADTGIGIPATQLDDIFDPFFQLDASSTRRFGGAGLGLSLCRELARLLGGELIAESAGEGRGSRFRCVLPLCVQAPQDAIAAGTSALVLADTLGGRRALAEALERLGVTTVTASESGEALGLLERSHAEDQPFRLLVLDIEEAPEQAFATIEALRRLQGPAAPAVVLLTARGIRGDAARSRELGLAAYLTKPVTLAELREAVLAVLCGPSADTLVTRHSLRERRPGPRLLLALGDAQVRNELAAALEAHSCRVTAVGDAQALRALWHGRRVDAVLVDRDVTVLDAEVAIAAAGEHTPRPLLIVVAREAPADLAGVDAWIEPPPTAAAVLAALDAHAPAGDAHAPSGDAQPSPGG